MESSADELVRSNLSAIQQVEQRMESLVSRMTFQRDSLEQVYGSMRDEHKILMDSISHLLLVRAIKASGECPASISTLPPLLSRHLEQDIIPSQEEEKYDFDMGRRISGATLANRKASTSSLGGQTAKLLSRFTPRRSRDDDSNPSAAAAALLADDTASVDDFHVRRRLESFGGIVLRSDSTRIKERVTPSIGSLPTSRVSSSTDITLPVTPTAEADDSGGKRSTVSKLAKAFGKTQQQSSSTTTIGSQSVSSGNAVSTTTSTSTSTTPAKMSSLARGPNAKLTKTNSLQGSASLDVASHNPAIAATPSYCEEQDDGKKQSSSSGKSSFQFGIRRQKGKLTRQTDENSLPGSTHDIASAANGLNLLTSKDGSPSNPPPTSMSSLYSTAKITSRWLFGVKQKRSGTHKDERSKSVSDGMLGTDVDNKDVVGSRKLAPVARSDSDKRRFSDSMLDRASAGGDKVTVRKEAAGGPYRRTTPRLMTSDSPELASKRSSQTDDLRGGGGPRNTPGTQDTSSPPNKLRADSDPGKRQQLDSNDDASDAAGPTKVASSPPVSSNKRINKTLSQASSSSHLSTDSAEMISAGGASSLVKAKIKSFQDIVEKSEKIDPAAATKDKETDQKRLKRTRTFNDDWWQQRSASQKPSSVHKLSIN
ncbi:uncharacterized protein DDB_G0271670-like [Sycon ciliatum]|uniref:uncharacterized protein DDB_G0271670-like n=1 Tax=Sycon ciliatum TaxID=27933 RepID=UPI0031F6E201